MLTALLMHGFKLASVVFFLHSHDLKAFSSAFLLHESPPASLKLMLSDKKKQHRSNGFRQSNIRYSAVKKSVMAVKRVDGGCEEATLTL